MQHTSYLPFQHTLRLPSFLEETESSAVAKTRDPVKITAVNHIIPVCGMKFLDSVAATSSVLFLSECNVRSFYCRYILSPFSRMRKTGRLHEENWPLTHAYNGKQIITMPTTEIFISNNCLKFRRDKIRDPTCYL